MKKEHQEIIDLISSYLEEYPDQRFTQTLFNLGVNEFVNKERPEQANFAVRDVYNDLDKNVIEKIKDRLKYFEQQKNDNR